MAYIRTYVVDSSPGGDTVKAAVATKLDGDLTNAFTYLNAHDIATTSVHGFTGAKTGSGAMVGANTPTLITPVLGVATATSINKVAITTPATAATLTISDGKTFSCSGTLTLSGTDGSTLNIGTGGTLGTAAYTAATAYATSGHNHSGVYEASGAVSTHAALITGVHGLVFTAGKSLTLTESLTVNSAAAGALRVATAANTIGDLAVGLTTQILVGGGAGVVPAWGADIPTAVTIGTAYIYRAGGTDVAIADGGTGQSTAQTAIDALTAVSGATAEHVLTKDTVTGNAKFKVAPSLPTFSSAAEIWAGAEAGKAIAPDQARLAGQLVQVAHAVVTGMVSGSTAMPYDDTIPQNTEGFEVITCAITPKNANNLLVIVANIDVSYSAATAEVIGMALFQDATAGALAAMLAGYVSAYARGNKTLIHKMTAATTSATTFKVRVGCVNSDGTTYVNSVSTGRAYGGICSTTLTIFEFTP